jgi:hypothetical protein
MTRDRALLVGIGLDQARIHCKAFTANETGHDACLDDTFEHAAKNIPLAEALKNAASWLPIADRFRQLAEPPELMAAVIMDVGSKEAPLAVR